MSAILRRIAVSTTATVALLGGATTTAAAAPEHEATVIAIARTDTQPGITPNGGVGSQLQNSQQAPADYPQNIQTQASGAAIGTGVVVIAILGLVVFFRVKHGHLKVGDAVVVTFFGVALAGTVIGSMADQLTNTGAAALSNILGGLSR